MAKIIFEVIDKCQIGMIKPLWNKLREHHQSVSPYFSDFYDSFAFESRIKKFCKKSNVKLRIEIAKDKRNDNLIGYCICSIDDIKRGEVDSIYIDSEHRGQGVGDTFMKNGLRWMEENDVTSKVIGVSAGNEETFGFYAKYGFYPRVTILHQKLVDG